MSEFLKIGHRGAAGHEPENTMRSFVEAIKLGADALEFDIRSSADKKVVVIHDAMVDWTTTNGSGRVGSFTYNELRRFDAGRGEKIPALEQVFGVLGKENPWDWKPSFHIELKETGMEKEVLSLIERSHLIDSVIISAFDMCENEVGDTSRWDDLFALKQSEPNLRIALLVKSQENFGIALDLAANPGKIYAINPSRTIITQRMVENAHEKGVKIFVWTVNLPSEIARIKAMGVDGIFSDYPDRL